MIEIVIGKPVNNKVCKNTYQLVVEYMHGDADGYTTKDKTYPVSNIEQLKLDIVALTAVDDRDTVEDDVIVAFTSHGVTGDLDELYDAFRDNWFEGDITYEGEWAAVSSVTLFYFDEDGVKHNASWNK